MASVMGQGKYDSVRLDTVLRSVQVMKSLHWWAYWSAMNMHIVSDRFDE